MSNSSSVQLLAAEKHLRFARVSGGRSSVEVCSLDLRLAGMTVHVRAASRVQESPSHRTCPGDLISVQGEGFTLEAWKNTSVR